MMDGEEGKSLDLAEKNEIVIVVLNMGIPEQ